MGADVVAGSCAHTAAGSRAAGAARVGAAAPPAAPAAEWVELVVGVEVGDRHVRWPVVGSHLDAPAG
ncbi:hypothetical protein EF911_17200 [Streptomyces sp. WAC06128]|nr:hypothetical protein EF911_17200 [Streptomyces sp. WAC06128]